MGLDKRKDQVGLENADDLVGLGMQKQNDDAAATEDVALDVAPNSAE